MGTAVIICGGATGSDVSHVTGSDVVIVRKYVLRMRNQKLRSICDCGTGSDV
jgi:hypothetical protein